MKNKNTLFLSLFVQTVLMLIAYALNDIVLMYAIAFLYGTWIAFAFVKAFSCFYNQKPLVNMSVLGVNMMANPFAYFINIVVLALQNYFLNAYSFDPILVLLIAFNMLSILTLITAVSQANKRKAV